MAVTYEKAYKVLAKQENISNSKAKDLIDKGLVKVSNKKVTIARGEIRSDTKFNVRKLDDVKVIFQDNDILAVDKPAFLTAAEIEKKFPDAILLNRLDKETSGVMLFAKNEDFRIKAIKEFANKNVYKEYVAIVDGRFIEEMTLDQPIVTIKTKGAARSKVDYAKGKEAISIVSPMFVEGNKSKVKIVIKTGRTHQIRVHLDFAGFPIIGDAMYGKPASNINRVLLHSKITKIFDYKFVASEPREFKTYGFN